MVTQSQRHKLAEDGAYSIILIICMYSCSYMMDLYTALNPEEGCFGQNVHCNITVCKIDWYQKRKCQRLLASHMQSSHYWVCILLLINRDCTKPLNIVGSHFPFSCCVNIDIMCYVQYNVICVTTIVLEVSFEIWFSFFLCLHKSPTDATTLYPATWMANYLLW